MIKLLLQAAAFSAICVLLAPGNEVHRDQVFHGLLAAYANAATYCDRNQRSCAQIGATLAKMQRTLFDEQNGPSGAAGDYRLVEARSD